MLVVSSRDVQIVGQITEMKAVPLCQTKVDSQSKNLRELYEFIMILPTYSGLTPVVNYVHSKGLKFGLVSQ